MSTSMRGILALSLLAVMSIPAWGQVPVPVSYDIQKDLGLYGYLVQNDPSVLPVAIQGVACVPVATANSFVYLQNKYAAYGTKIVPDTDNDGVVDMSEIGAVASQLASPGFMNTQVATNGTYQAMGIYGKYTYLEQKAPGITTYGAQMSESWVLHAPPMAKPAWVQDNTYPRWQFLYNNLTACEDVEICINDADGWGHCLTLTSFHWTDGNSNVVPPVPADGIIQQGEATIDFIDPATGAWVAASPIWQNNLNGTLFVNYSLGHPQVELQMAMEESPEPATLSMLILGGLALMRRRRS